MELVINLLTHTIPVILALSTHTHHLMVSYVNHALPTHSQRVWVQPNVLHAPVVLHITLVPTTVMLVIHSNTPQDRVLPVAYVLWVPTPLAEHALALSVLQDQLLIPPLLIVPDVQQDHMHQEEEHCVFLAQQGQSPTSPVLTFVHIVLAVMTLILLVHTVLNVLRELTPLRRVLVPLALLTLTLMTQPAPAVFVLMDLKKMAPNKVVKIVLLVNSLWVVLPVRSAPLERTTL